MAKDKQRKKARRRVEKAIERAFEALAEGELDRARKLAGRACDEGGLNPRIQCDYGCLLVACGDFDDAEVAFRHAIALAPTYAEAFAGLAGVMAKLGKPGQALSFQRRVVELRPDDADARAVLESYLLLVGAVPSGKIGFVDSVGTPLTDRTQRFDWEEVEKALATRGVARLEAILDPRECHELAALWGDEDRFEHEVAVDDPEQGLVRYRFFVEPLPAAVRELRAEVYLRLAPIANRWQELTGRPERFPEDHAEFLAACREQGQHRSAPILLRYPPGGWNGLHQDLAGRLAFPFQLAVSLGPASRSEALGGEFELVDQRMGRVRPRACIETGAGDGVVFCTRERLVSLAGTWGMQPVRHGVREVRAQERFALGVPFHNYA